MIESETTTPWRTRSAAVRRNSSRTLLERLRLNVENACVGASRELLLVREIDLQIQRIGARTSASQEKERLLIELQACTRSAKRAGLRESGVSSGRARGHAAEHLRARDVIRSAGERGIGI